MAASLNKPQFQFKQLTHKFRAYVAGFGSGKTWVGCTELCDNAWRYPLVAQGYFAPTYPHIKDIFWPTIDEVAHTVGLKTRIKTGDKEVEFYAGRQYRGTVICRSMDRPETIVGFKIGHALVDELDVLKKDKAALAWRKIIARLRWVDTRFDIKNGVDVTTTPEGFQFVHHQFVDEIRKHPELQALYGLVQASTYDNEINLPPDYIPSLFQSYPGPLIDAYINGQFCNLTSGSVYPAFSRIGNCTFETIRPEEYLHIGMDFNVTKMAAIVHVMREGRPYALDEFTGIFDTPAMVQAIKNRYPGRRACVYPDASGNARKTNNASTSDHAILRGAGFEVIVDGSNPSVRDRINAMNSALTRGYWVNPDKCPVYTESLERQAYDENGEPDKKAGYDHTNDAGGYFIAKQFPLTHNRVQLIGLQGK